LDRGDSEQAAAVKVVARAHQTLIWERTRHMLRMRQALREYFPAALEAYAGAGLAAADTLELLVMAPDPARAARLSPARITAALKRARRRDTAGKGRHDRGRAARRPAHPAAGGDRGLRGRRAGHRQGDHHAERAGQGTGSPGACPFWGAPGR